MTRANSFQPPRLATWLLDQFSPVLQNAPLAGDLMEAFKQGRSSSWYWRQVFGAILIALPRLLRKQWGCLAYAVGCSGLTSAAWFFVTPIGHGSALPQVFALYAKGYAIQWPWSLAYQMAFLTAFQFVVVAVALGAYLVFSGMFSPQTLLRTLMVVIVALANGNVAMTFLSVILMRLGLLGWMLVFCTPTTVALLLGMWNANLGSTSRPVST
jgi:hypothetical protein